MCSVPSEKAGVATVVDSKAGSSFFKDVRKISVGDCALFETVQDSPPSVGIIRSLGSDKENLQLGVNRLYRPADIKLVKGGALEAAPNEVFYSFDSDEIPAASLLHPCKVAFLPKGVELPSGVSSFVCRRVYDTANKCLWWLTDQDIINDQRKEVDQLLRKTQSEMHATVQQQQGGRSPKPGSSPMSTSQLKQSPDSVQNSGTTFPAHQKGKKRERSSDQVSEPVKRERTSRADDGDFGSLRSESVVKSEITKITDKGGLVDSEGVERLVQLMHPDKPERRIDLACRSLLTGVIAATDKIDCLNRFVQLRGLPVLDEWLQDVHKGKVGDSSSPRDHDRSVEDFLLVLLRALDRLPVNLEALQTCNIGKSVNHLRSHRNSEIQKKARTLVDTWKKRVEAEMNINDAKSTSSQAVAWTARTRHEVSHGGNRHTGGSLDTSTKNSVLQPSAKSTSVKLVSGEVGKMSSAAASPGNVKLASSPASTGANMRDGHLRMSVINSTSELPQSAMRDDKSSSSSQSHTNSQCSSDHARNPALSGKEDTRSSNSGSTSLNKSSGSASRQRKSANGLQALAASSIQRDGGSNRNNSLARVPAAEKLSQSPGACEKSVDTPVSDSNNQKLIVKISNRGRSPAQSVNGGSVEDPSLTNSRASSPVHSEKHGQLDRSSKDKNDCCRNNTMPDANNESWQSNDLKDGVTGCDEGYGSPATALDFGRCQTGEGTGKLADVTKGVSSSKSEMKPRKPLDSSLSSIDALIESCVKYSEGNASMSTGDDVGMNLLASVAAGEISKSNGASPAQSPQGSASVPDEAIRSSLHCDDVSGVNHNLVNDAADVAVQKQIIGAGSIHADKGNQGDQFVTTGKDLLHVVDMSLRPDVKTNDSGGAPSVSTSPTCAGGGDGVRYDHETKATVKDDSDVCVPDRRQGAIEDRGTDISLKERSPAKASETMSLPAVHEKNGIKDEPNINISVEKPSSAVRLPESVVKKEKAAVPSCVVNDLLPGQLNDLKADEVEGSCGRHVDQDANKDAKPEDVLPATHKQEESELLSAVNDQKTKDHGEDIGKKEVAGSANKISSSSCAAHERELCSDTKVSLFFAGEMEQHALGAVDTSSPAAGSSGTDGRLEFDLNEGFNVDDSKDEDPSGAAVPGSVSSFRLSGPLPAISVASTSVNVPSLITVTAAAKGPFVPPENLLRNKGELGWKGSAATSAFRPAEPRKVSELSSMNNNVPLPDVSAGKQGRVLLEIDLNVADDSILEDMGQSSDAKLDKRDHSGASHGAASMHSAGGLDLDLNRVEEAPELAQLPSNTHRSEARLQPAKMSSSSGLSNSESARRDFDLNNGPVADEATVDSSSYNLHGRPNLLVQPSVGFRISSTEVGNLNSWYPAGSAFSAIPMPSPLSDREQPFAMVGTSGGPPRILGASTGTIPFNPDMFRGSVLSSSPAVPFPAAPFQYPVFPFGTSFPVPSSSLAGGSPAFVDLSSGGRLCVPAVPSQLVGSSPAVSSQYPRPYVVSLSDVSNSVAVENARKWGRQGLDLNAGPGGPEVEGRDEHLPIPPRPVSAMGSLAFAEEHSRMYPMAGGVLKRKEPEGGWDTDRLSGYKQPSWQ